jgi:uncharacterized membrane protein YjjP (DUF1212 family)
MENKEKIKEIQRLLLSIQVHELKIKRIKKKIQELTED